MTRASRFFFLAAVAAFATAACENTAAPVQPEVRIAARDLTVMVEDTAHLALTDVAAWTSAGLAWASSDTMIATVDTAGVVWTHRTGTVTIRVSNQASADSAVLTVRAPDAVSYRQLVTSGTANTCGLVTDGRVYCFIDISRARHRQGWVLAGHKVTALTDGLCALTDAGAVLCVSPDSAYGAPVQISGATFHRISGSAAYGCGIATDGRTLCWTGGGAPAPLAGDPGLVSVSVDGNPFMTRFGCGLTAAGAAYCWGANASGQLGDGTTTTRAAAAPVSGGLQFTTLSTGSATTCGLITTGEAYCWGASTLYTLGVPNTPRAGCDSNDSGYSRSQVTWCTVPQRVETQLRFVEIDVTWYNTCARTAEGRAYCWGLNFQRALGSQDSEIGYAMCRTGMYHACTPVPTEVSGGRTYAALASTASIHRCALDAQGAAYCWGMVTAAGTPEHDGFTLGGGVSPPVRLAEPRRRPNTAP